MDCMRSLQILDTVGNVGTVIVVHHTGESALFLSLWLPVTWQIHSNRRG